MLIRKSSHLISLLFLMVFLAVMALPNAYAKDSCINCHKDSKFRVQNKVVFDYYNRWKDSSHDLAGVTCTDCHRGDPTNADKDGAHSDGFMSPQVSNDTFFKKVPETCGTAKCHPAVLKNFTKSKHYKVLKKKGKGPHCATCHGSVNSEVYYTSIISRTCEACHNKETEISPEVTGLADNILQRINVSHGYRNWIMIFYSDKEPAKVKEINTLYSEIADSWHRFNFELVDEKSKELLNKLKSVVNRGLAEKKKNKAKKK